MDAILILGLKLDTKLEESKMTFADYVSQYLNKPNVSTGKAFWYDAEVSAATGTPVTQIAAWRAFAQTVASQWHQQGKPDPTVEEYVKAWETRPVSSGSKPPTAQASGQPRKIGDYSDVEFWARMRKELDG